MAAEPWPSQHLQLVSVIINQGWGGFSVASGQGAFLSPFSQEVGRQQGGLGRRRSTQPRLQLAIGLPSDAQLSAEGLGCFPRACPKRISELPELCVVLWPPHARRKHLHREVQSPARMLRPKRWVSPVACSVDRLSEDLYSKPR